MAAESAAAETLLRSSLDSLHAADFWQEAAFAVAEVGIAVQDESGGLTALGLEAPGGESGKRLRLSWHCAAALAGFFASYASFVACASVVGCLGAVVLHQLALSGTIKSCVVDTV